MTSKKIVPFTAPVADLCDLYIRVSTTEQAMEGYSVAEQENRLRRYCEAMGFKIYKVHIDAGYSGASLNRPAIQEMIQDIQSHLVNRVVVWKLDRLSRSQKDTIVLLEDVFLANSCDFLSMMESFDTSTAFGRAIIGILAAFAQLERENIKERTTMGRQARLANGHYNSSRPPLGYCFLPNCNDLQLVPYEATIVREIFESFLSGSSINHIAKCMKEKYPGVRSWDNNTVRRTLRNYAYIGKVQDVDTIRDGIHDPIITETDFCMANAILDHNLQEKKHSCTTDNLLTGLLYCGDCGARMQPKKIARGYALRRYVCYSVSRSNKSMIRSENCTNRLHPYTQQELDAIIIHEIAKLGSDSGYLEKILEKPQQKSNDQQLLFKDRIAEIDRQSDKLLNLYQIGVVNLPQIEERLLSLKQERAALLKNLESMQGTVSQPLDSSMVRSYSSAFQEALENGDSDSIHRIVHLLIDKIIVLNEDVEIHWSFC